MQRFIKKYFFYVILGLALIFTILSALALRMNHARMNTLKEQVIDDDHSNDFVSLATDLTKLKQYVDTHIVPNFNEDPNTGKFQLFWGTGVFYLQKSYQKAATEVVNAAQNELASGVNDDVYAEVRDICDPQFDHWSQSYVNCFVAELDKYLPADYAMPEIALPDPSLYHMSYASPNLAWDWASFFSVVSICTYVVFFTTLCSSVIRKFLPNSAKNP